MNYHVFKLEHVKNRAYVIDLCGNKVYYGTMYRCRKFIDYMEGREQHGREENDSVTGWKDGVPLDNERKAVD